jgi:uncharacterized protein YciI
MYCILFYDYVPDMLERRGPVRPAHLDLATSWHESGRLLFAGALADPVDSAVFVFKVEAKEEIDEFIASDPYVSTGLVTGHRVREWNIVIGQP